MHTKVTHPIFNSPTTRMEFSSKLYNNISAHHNETNTFYSKIVYWAVNFND